MFGKKILGFLLAVCVVAFVLVAPIGVCAEGVDVDIDMGEGVVFTPGDIDGNDKVNLNDVVLLAQYVAQWDVADEVVVAALDPDGNSKSDLQDVIRLSQYVAKWNVTLSEDAYVA